MEYLKQINTPKLSDEDKLVCEGKLSMEERWSALQSMSNGKRPGSHGLTREFYVCFWEDIGSCLVSTLNYSFEHGEFTFSQKQAVLTLIEEKGRGKKLVKTWRPISLINVDTKIASKSSAMRAKNVISHLVNCDQTAYVKGINIGESIRPIDDLMNYAEQENLGGLSFAADIEKAFDSVDHKFIFASLEKYGFGPDFIQWIKTLLTNNESCVMNNGSSTGLFKIQRGMKQGDPLSPHLFILVLKILFIQIRNDKAIRGFKIGDIEIRLTAFADDSTFLCETNNQLIES